VRLAQRSPKALLSRFAPIELPWDWGSPHPDLGATGFSVSPSLRPSVPDFRLPDQEF
jgi:hypothetical protein